MPQLPILSPKEIIKALSKVGYVVVRQKGSHMRLHSASRPQWPVTVPNYKSIDRSLLLKILRDAGLTSEQFLSFL